MLKFVCTLVLLGLVLTDSSVKAQDQQACDLCVSFFTNVRQSLSDNTTEVEIVEVLNQFCENFGPLNFVCKGWVSNNLPTLITELSNHIEPLAICTKINVCANTTVVVKAETPCEMCQIVLNTTRNKFADNATQQEVLTELNQFCSKLGPLSANCTEFVNTNVPLIFEDIVTNLDSSVICQKLGLCQQSMRRIFVAPVQKKVQLETPCLMCNLLLNATRNIFSDNATEQQVVDELNRYCSILGSLATNCTEFVNIHVPAVFEEIVSNTDPEVVCEKIKVCPAQKSIMKRRYLIASKHVSLETPCLMCNLLLNATESFISDNTTQQQLVALLNLGCLSYGPFVNQCRQFVNDNYQQIFQAIENDIEPSAVCKAIRVCPKTALKTLLFRQTETFFTPCEACVGLLNYTRNELALNSTQQAIIQYDLVYCHRFGPLVARCQDFVNNNAAAIFAAILDDIQPVKICTEFQFCDTPSTTTQQTTITVPISTTA